MTATSRIMVTGERGRDRLRPLKLAYRQVLTIRKDNNASSASHPAHHIQPRNGAPSQAYTMLLTTAAPEGIARPTKYFRSGRPGFFGIGFFWMLNRARRIAPHSRKIKE